MPRNSSGVYTLPAGNPVVADTIIDVDWANPTMADIGNEITLSLPRNGSAGMTGPLTLIGNAVSPLQAVPLQQLQSTTGLYLPLTGGTLTGDLTFTGDGRRIRGDFSNAAASNRVQFQTNTPNAETYLGVIPNGSSRVSYLQAWNNSDLTNSSRIGMFSSETVVGIDSGIAGSGAFLPMLFYVGGSERMRIETNGNIGIGSPAASGFKTEIFSTSISSPASTSPHLSLRDLGGNSSLNFTAANEGGAFVERVWAGGALSLGTSGVERMRIAADGIISISNGIKFPAAQAASADPNVLDDYEEGSCTLSILSDTTNPTTPPASTGRYTKVGNLVTISGLFSNVDTSGGSGYMRIGGLPFVCAGINTNGAVTMAGFGTDPVIVQSQMATASVFVLAITTTNRINIVAGAGKYFYFTISYIVA